MQAVSDSRFHRMREQLDLMRDIADTLQTQCVDLSTAQEDVSERLSDRLMRIESDLHHMEQILESSQVGVGGAMAVDEEASEGPDNSKSDKAVRVDGGVSEDFEQGESKGQQQLQEGVGPLGVGSLTSEALCEATSSGFFLTKMSSLPPGGIDKGPAEMTEGNHHNTIIAPRALDQSASHSRGRSSSLPPRVVPPSLHDDASPSCQRSSGGQVRIGDFEFLHQLLVQNHAVACMDASQLPNQHDPQLEGNEFHLHERGSMSTCNEGPAQFRVSSLELAHVMSLLPPWDLGRRLLSKDLSSQSLPRCGRYVIDCSDPAMRSTWERMPSDVARKLGRRLDDDTTDQRPAVHLDEVHLRPSQNNDDEYRAPKTDPSKVDDTSRPAGSSSSSDAVSARLPSDARVGIPPATEKDSPLVNPGEMQTIRYQHDPRIEGTLFHLDERGNKPPRNDGPAASRLSPLDLGNIISFSQPWDLSQLCFSTDIASQAPIHQCAYLAIDWRDASTRDMCQRIPIPAARRLGRRLINLETLVVRYPIGSPLWCFDVWVSCRLMPRLAMILNQSRKPLGVDPYASEGQWWERESVTGPFP
ncbi:unnamed protein product [Vitrella brassicaformis CCMP3155]|uniref:Uncharacterized protein n=1 Tax=Vitrella brassicaformis (strain CCMP3155) TaxID=1169540 RepID=A0A0G4GTE4_VITBC|nr:unnamed protein product [Vitrella brassicaformis CCMP3155]|eukprot:CEM33760.1 unnamed protein product [Vitrella brassicaformis CCMP3155]